MGFHQAKGVNFGAREGRMVRRSRMYGHGRTNSMDVCKGHEGEKQAEGVDLNAWYGWMVQVGCFKALEVHDQGRTDALRVSWLHGTIRTCEEMHSILQCSLS